jgi:predicted glycosyltransferase
MTRSV